MPISFAIAAEAAEPAAEEKVVEVPIGDRVFYARRPTVAQAALLNKSLAAPILADRIVAVFRLIEGLLGEDARDLIEELLWSRRIDLDDLVGGSEQNPEGGLVDQIFSEFSAFPTVPSTGSSASRRSGGQRSTGRSPGKGSTRSPSPSSAS
jgi:hypothetical protein